MAWQTPKTDWDTNPKNPKAEDMNRIEENIDFLKTDIETKKGLIVDAVNNIGGDSEITDTHAQIAAELNSLLLTGNAAASEVLSGKTFYSNNPKNKITGTIPSKGSQTFTPGTANQTIAAGQYLSGVQTIAGDPDLLSANIKAGVNIFGVAGNSNVVDTSAGDAVAADIYPGKKAYVDGALITGTMPTQAAQTITPGTTNKTIASGRYLTGTQTISGSSNLIASNILYGVNIFGVVGNNTGITFTPGTKKILSNTTHMHPKNTSYYKIREMQVYHGGTINVRMVYNGGAYSDINVRVYINGVARTPERVGSGGSKRTSIETVTVNPNDYVQVYARTPGNAATDFWEMHIEVGNDVSPGRVL